MARIPFDDGWSVRLPLGPFAAMLGADAEPSPVTLPHDALRDAERSADVPSKGAGAYYPPGAYTYLKTFDVPAEWTEKLIFLEFQGAYRHAAVFVNEEFAGNRADGYARFVIDATPYGKHRQPNQLRVEVRAKPKTTERFDADTWTTFDGRALAVVRPTGPGAITLTVTSRANDAGPIDALPAEATDTVQIEIEVSK